MSEILIQSGETILKASPAVQQEPTSSFDFLHILRILFYILVAVKLIELSFLRRKKPSIKERVYRKFLFAHQELLKQFTEEDKANMEHTLSNTIKNANIDYKPTRNKNPKSKKRVNFSVEKNNYYDPKHWKNEVEDEDLYLDVEDAKANTLFDIAKEGDVRGKMMEEEFTERKDLEKINEKEEQIQIEASKLTQETQPSSVVGISELSPVSELPVQSKDSLLSSKEAQAASKADAVEEVSELLLTSIASKKVQ